MFSCLGFFSKSCLVQDKQVLSLSSLFQNVADSRALQNTLRYSVPKDQADCLSLLSFSTVFCQQVSSLLLLRCLYSQYVPHLFCIASVKVKTIFNCFLLLFSHGIPFFSPSKRLFFLSFPGVRLLFFSPLSATKSRMLYENLKANRKYTKFSLYKNLLRPKINPTIKSPLRLVLIRMQFLHKYGRALLSSRLKLSSITYIRSIRYGFVLVFLKTRCFQ